MTPALSSMFGLLAAACWPRQPGPVAWDEARAPVRVLRAGSSTVPGGANPGEAHPGAESPDAVVPGAPVTWTATIRAGSAHDPVGQEGLAWLVAEQIADRMAPAGVVELRVGVEVIDFALTCPDL
ncbi:MAG: hypothetical protein D6798_15740, partial [Deltaproteobacteria bacterium]